MGKLWGAVILALAGVAAWAQPRGVEAKADWLFQTTSTYDMAIPVLVELANSGPPLEGEVFLEGSSMYGGSSTRTVTPINLPTGSRKQVVLYGQESYGGPGDVIVSSNRGTFKVKLAQNLNGGNSPAILIVTDSPGEFGFLGQKSAQGQARYNTAYVSVSRAPDHLRGYSSMAAIVLSEGSERMKDGAIAAIHQYVLAGGTVVFAGGAGGNAIDDPRWAKLAPIRNRRPQQLSRPGNLVYGGSPVNGAITVWKGEIHPEAREAGGTVVRRSFGMGTVVYIGLDLLASPLDKWPSREKFFSRASKVSNAEQAFEGLKRRMSSGEGYYDSYYPYGGGNPRPPQPASDSGPFKLDLPDSATVWWTLIIYSIIVGPINFIWLRRIKRVELAWITAPIISVIFAGIFLIRALPLYQQPMSSRVNGIVIEQAGVPGAIFAGNADLFFPIGGSYPLKLQNVEMISSEREYGQSNQAIEEIVDLGTLDVPRFRASNLAFENIGLMELLPTTQLLQATAISTAKGIEIKIKNASPYVLEQITDEPKTVTLASLKPGASYTRIVPGNASGKMRIKLRGRIVGMRPGPQIGRHDAKGSVIEFESYVPVRSPSP